MIFLLSISLTKLSNESQPSCHVSLAHDEDMGGIGIGEKNDGRKMGLVRIHSMQQLIKMHKNSLQNLPLRSKRAHQRTVE
jgi:hypothetical protein